MRVRHLVLTLSLACHGVGEEGVIETGTWNELVDKNGAFVALLEAQKMSASKVDEVARQADRVRAWMEETERFFGEISSGKTLP